MNYETNYNHKDDDLFSNQIELLLNKYLLKN